MIPCFFVRVLSPTHTQTGSLWGTWSPSAGSGSSGLQVKILKRQLITKLTVQTGCGADFWEFLPVVSRKSPLWISTTIMAASCAGSVIIYVYMHTQRMCITYMIDVNIYLWIYREYGYTYAEMCVYTYTWVYIYTYINWYVYMSVYIYIYKLITVKEQTLCLATFCADSLLFFYLLSSFLALSRWRMTLLVFAPPAYICIYVIYKQNKRIGMRCIDRESLRMRYRQRKECA